jgi:NAD+ diphosphatase
MLEKQAYKFCPRCKANLKLEKENLLHCTMCDLHLYISPKVTNGVIIVDDKGEILLTKRKTSPKKGWWDLPGGFADIGESMEESVIRELHEELGAEIDELQYLASYYGLYEFKGITYNTLGFIYVAKLKKNAKLKAADDVASFKYFKPNNIPYEKLAFREVRKGLEDYIRLTSAN